MSLFAMAKSLQHRSWFGWAFGVLSFLMALLLRFSLNRTLPPGYPFLTFFPVVILTTFLGGLRPGIVCAIASGAAAWYWFIAPHASLAAFEPAVVAFAWYMVIVVVTVVIVHVMNVSLERLRREQALTAALYDEQRVMFQELQHRVANNLAFIASLLTLYKRKAGSNPAAAAAALDEARSRVGIIARIHRHLYDPAAVNLPVQRHLEELCTDLLDVTGAHGIICDVDSSDIRLDIGTLLTLSLIVTKVVTNSLKYAFGEGKEGSIAIRLERLERKRLVLTIRDNGRGYPVDFKPVTNNSLGGRIVHGLVMQLQGDIDYSTDGGAVVRLTFPASA